MTGSRSFRIRIVAGIALVACVLVGCTRLPERPEVAPAVAQPAAESGDVMAAAAAAVQASAGPDAILTLANARDALDWRLALIDSADVSLDLQYFVWSNDAVGNLVLQRLLQAADRGVKVRVLVDDLYLLSDSSMRGPDTGLAAVDRHPNVELRVYNPGKYRSGTMGIAGNFMGSFGEFNRRMHNKLFIADGHLAIVGGRNIANEYYGLKAEYNFLDLDVMVAGAVVPEMIESFDQYWNADTVFPAMGLVPELEDNAGQRLRGELSQYLADNDARLVSYPVPPQDWSVQLASLPRMMLPADTVFLQDDPALAGDEGYRLADMLAEFDRPQDQEVIIVTPYLIPLEGMIEDLKASIDQGIEVTLLTASLASGDHTAVNAHYKKYRKDLILAGAKLYEFHHQPGKALRAMADVAPVAGEFVALHPKVGVTDRKHCFVGSLNLDPRALVINKENGLQIESEAVCGELADLLELYIAPENAWQVTLDEQGELRWTSAEGTVHRQPARSGGQRMSDFFFRILPIESLL